MTAGFAADDRPIDEILAEAEVLGRPGTLRSELDAVSAQAGDDLVHVTVNIHGKLCALRLDPGVRALAPAELAARVRTQVASAAADALRQGLEHLERATNPMVTASVAFALHERPTPVVPAAERLVAARPVEDDDDEEPFELKPLD